MGLLNGVEVMNLLSGFRVVHIEGRFGSGKTALAYKFAHELCAKHGFRYVLSNCNDVWSDNADEIVLRPDQHGDPTYIDAVVILDEAGIVFEGRKHVSQFVAYMRKLNVCLILPSIEKPPSRVRFLRVIRRYNYNALGIPLWWYQARLNSGTDRVTYHFGWWRPSEIFGVYDTGDFPADDSNIGDFLEYHVDRKTGNRLKSRSNPGRRNFKRGRNAAYGASANRGGQAHGQRRVSPWANIPLDEGGREFDAFTDAAEEIADALTLFEDWTRKPNKRKRRD